MTNIIDFEQHKNKKEKAQENLENLTKEPIFTFAPLEDLINKLDADFEELREKRTKSYLKLFIVLEIWCIFLVMLRFFY